VGLGAGNLREPAQYARISRCPTLKFVAAEDGMSETSKSAGGRGISGLEFALAAAIVLGHNVWNLLPNEVPILAIAGLILVRVREGGWAVLGFRRPSSWSRVILIALAAAVLRIILSVPIEAALTQFWPAPTAPAIAAGPHDLNWLITILALVWTFAAFGEEIAYRGYITLRAADVLGGSRWAWLIATIAAAVLFGFGHYYKGPVGIVDSGVAGLILGAAYLLSGRCLWTTILAHGLIDTTGVFLLYLGLAD
jgi:membrane protease YdiL (CAAX protease family)